MNVGQAASVAPNNKIVRAVRVVLLVALAATGIIGLLHTKVGKPLLMKMGGCPAGFATRDEMEDIRKYAVANTTSAAAGEASVRPALGFVLDTTTEDEAKAWAAKNKVTCETNDQLGQIICDNVPASAVGQTATLPAIEQLTLAFNRDKKVVNILALRHGLSSQDAYAVYMSRVNALQKDLGAPVTQRAPTGSDYFDKEILISSSAEYRFKNYESEVSATTMVDKTVTVREHYLSTL